jgi:hypothetical protein
VLAAGGIGFGHAVAHGQTSDGALGGITGMALIHAPVPLPSVLAVHEVRHPGDHSAPQPLPHHRPRPAALRITDTGAACYVQVTRGNGQLLVRRILHGHQHLAFRRHGLDVVLGNAGGVRVALNGRRAQRAGTSGEVLRFRVR